MLPGQSPRREVLNQAANCTSTPEAEVRAVPAGPGPSRAGFLQPTVQPTVQPRPVGGLGQTQVSENLGCEISTPPNSLASRYNGGVKKLREPVVWGWNPAEAMG